MTDTLDRAKEALIARFRLSGASFYEADDLVKRHEALVRAILAEKGFADPPIGPSPEPAISDVAHLAKEWTAAKVETSHIRSELAALRARVGEARKVLSAVNPRPINRINEALALLADAGGGATGTGGGPDNSRPAQQEDQPGNITSPAPSTSGPADRTVAQDELDDCYQRGKWPPEPADLR